MRCEVSVGRSPSMVSAFSRRWLNRLRACLPGNRGELTITDGPSTAPECDARSSVARNEESRAGISEETVEDAVNETGFGKYNLKVMTVCALIYTSVAFSLNSIAFVMPAASCDFQMTTIDQGRLSTSTMMGMLCGSYFWGCLANVKGRKPSMAIALFVHGGCELIASIVPEYWGFLFLKFVSGIAMVGQVTLVYTYLGEFQPTRYRDRLLSWLEMAWVLGFVILPLIAWGIIPAPIEIGFGEFRIHSWNVFVLVCATMPIVTGLCFVAFPETPKYLADRGRSEELLKVLSMMYHQNTKEPPENYVEKLKSSKNEALSRITSIVPGARNPPATTTSMRSIFKSICLQTMMIVKPPHFLKSFLLCLITYSVASSYYALMLWLPGLFQKFAAYEKLFPNASVDMCVVVNLPENDAIPGDPFGCNLPIQTTVYIQSLILGASSLPVAVLMPLLIDRLGYYFFFTISALTSGIVTLGLLYVNTSTETVILSCTYEALTSICITVVACVVIDFYPTNLRSTAAGLVALFARLGAISGNNMFSYLIEEHCVILICIVAGQLFLSAALCLLAMRNAKSKANERKQRHLEQNHPT